MTLRHNFQTISWFNDLRSRGRLDLDPPYQRRSVWNRSFQEYFIETILLGYPSPAIFLHEEISTTGSSTYHVVDGKQRLSTIFAFLDEEFPTNSRFARQDLADVYFSQLPDEEKRKFWSYEMLVEYIPTTDQVMIDGIFDRLNRNTAKLTRQELRHAKYDGNFIQACENLSEWLQGVLPNNFPRIAQHSKRQMKDVEFIASLLLLLENGTRSYSQNDLDTAFNERDEIWDEEQAICGRFRRAVDVICRLVAADGYNTFETTRFRNQADFYSLFGAIDRLLENGSDIQPDAAVAALVAFAENVEQQGRSEETDDKDFHDYFNAARSASNDKTPRDTRIRIVAGILAGDIQT